MRQPLYYSLFVLICFPFLLFAQTGGWTDLFNGKDLNNWEIRNGSATFQIEDGEIVGRTKTKTRNTFLCTKQNYGDFILELEVLVNPSLNSGIQIRSNILPDYYDGVVHGYQVEIDPSARAFSGGIYDESRRGWIYPLVEFPASNAAFKNGQWNHFRIEAIGPHIRTWINGVNCANLADDLTAEGFIGLQVHSIGDEKDAGKQVRWRNIRIKTNPVDADRKAMHPAVPEKNLMANNLTTAEKRKGWRLLWDGKTQNGWKTVNGKAIAGDAWQIREGALHHIGGQKGGDLITEEQFSNFELRLEVKFSEGANSGIKYLVDPKLSEDSAFGIGLEYQILDDKKHPDAKEGVQGNRTLASLYDLIPAKNLSVKGRHKDFRGIDKWNQVRIIVKGNHIEHWLNGFKMLSYDRDTQMFDALISHSKYKDIPDFGKAIEGHILLQDHGDAVSFRSIKIRAL